jgi:hypothetical protein
MLSLGDTMNKKVKKAKNASRGAKKAPARETSAKKHPMKAQSKTTIRMFGKTAVLKMARYYKERIGAELLSKEPRYNKDLEMWEFDILKDD